MSRVEIELLPWVGDHEAAEGETPFILAAASIVVVDGERVISRRARVMLDGFATVEIERPSVEMKARYSPGEFLEGTDDDRLILPITELVIR